MLLCVCNLHLISLSLSQESNKERKGRERERERQTDRQTEGYDQIKLATASNKKETNVGMSVDILFYGPNLLLPYGGGEWMHAGKMDSCQQPIWRHRGQTGSRLCILYRCCFSPTILYLPWAATIVCLSCLSRDVASSSFLLLLLLNEEEEIRNGAQGNNGASKVEARSAVLDGKMKFNFHGLRDDKGT